MEKNQLIKQKLEAKAFVERWEKRAGREESEARSFWIDFFQVLGIENPTEKLDFEKRIKNRKIDIYYEEQRVIIENKSKTSSLVEPRDNKQYGLESPYKQAHWYYEEFGAMKKPYWIVLCNFNEFHIYDMRTSNPYEGQCKKIKLEELPDNLQHFAFLIDEKSSVTIQEQDLSVKAAELVKELYNVMKCQYSDLETNTDSQNDLNILIVRIVFLLYADKAGLFSEYLAFHNYMKRFKEEEFHNRLEELFAVLDTPPNERKKYLAEKLNAFCYVNGGLFSKRINIPPFTRLAILTLNKASEFRWEQLNPTIFGATFESTLFTLIRRSGGMHYTSKENIHKVIDPLFLDGLKQELSEIEKQQSIKARNLKLLKFKEKLKNLTFLDPACGSGNFLTESYIELRKLENRVIADILDGDALLFSNYSPEDTIQVQISQFYGIEINDFAVEVAKTALWIAEQQMLEETQALLPDYEFSFLPLKSNNSIVLGNALQIPWEGLVPNGKLDYIIGNPPFVGYSNQTKQQKQDMHATYQDEKGKFYKNSGTIDYVSAWFFKASKFMATYPNVRTALVATNSITQGTQVKPIWEPLYNRFGIHIDFAYRTFQWNNEVIAKNMAHVHCVIVGFSCDKLRGRSPKRICKIYDNDEIVESNVINPYLDPDSVYFIDTRSTSLCPAPLMETGGKPCEGGYLIFSEAEKDELLRLEPGATPYIRVCIGADELLGNKPARYCLWLPNITERELYDLPYVQQRVDKVRDFRLSSVKPATRKSAKTPHRFQEVNKYPGEELLLFPETSSERRTYIPMAFVKSNVIPTNSLKVVCNASVYHFGVLQSIVHMAWMRAFAGRLESRYRYSVDMVYNNFPWCNPTKQQKLRIEQTAQQLLDVKAEYSDYSLAKLYKKMPDKLLQAHEANDKAVLDAYGLSLDLAEPSAETEIVKRLTRLYAKYRKCEQTFST